MQVKIDGINFQGDGYGIINNKKVLIPKTYRGDSVEFEIVRENKDFIYGKLVKLLEKSDERIVITCIAEEENERKVLHIDIEDFGCGMESVEKALQPFYTTLSMGERSGMGFTIMQTFMTEFSVRSELGKGTLVSMVKILDEEDREEKNA